MTKRTGATALAVGGVAVATVLAAVATNGNLSAAVAPVLALLALYALWTAPLRGCVFVLFFLCIVADVPQDDPMSGHWRSPLYFIGELLCTNWSKTFGVHALSFSGLDIAAAVLLVRAGFEPVARLAQPLRQASVVFVATLAFLGVAGLARGGNLDAAYWQTRQLAYLPILLWLCAYALRDARDWRRFAWLILSAAIVKCLVGLYFRFFVALPRGIDSPVILSHAETVLLCLSVAMLVARWVEHPDRFALRRCLFLVPLFVAVIWLNNRRLAYAGLGTSLTIVWILGRWNRAKRAVARLSLLAIPVVVLYVVVGWESSEPAFKPVAAIRTVISPDDRAEDAADSSTRWRDIENFNLSQTLREHPIGTGLGQPYVEVEKGPDISRDFSLYRYIPHNSVLWMLTVGGPLGFLLLWSLFLTGMFLAARSHHLARTPLHRCAAAVSLCAQVLFLIQAWGDMGTQTWSGAWLMGAALASSGRLAFETGAWRAAPPAPSPDGAAAARISELRPTA
ncbi:MAG TPA: O-antigen ligase family protein [Myxococcales bacterium]|nr:O-antigen ligase family protein [Myxococcales bacterium]